jgi:hypothetical protein
MELGFAALGAYLEDRLFEREWLLVDVAAELAAYRRTIRRLMRQAGVRRSSGCGPSLGWAAAGW